MLSLFGRGTGHAAVPSQEPQEEGEQVELFDATATLRPTATERQVEEELALTVFSAAQQGRLTFLKENLTELDALDSEACSCLHWAAINNHCHVVTWLLKVWLACCLVLSSFLCFHFISIF